MSRDELPKPNEVREYRSKFNSAFQAITNTVRADLDVPYLPQDDELDRLADKADALAQEYARVQTEFRARANDIASEARIRAQDMQKELEGMAVACPPGGATGSPDGGRGVKRMEQTQNSGRG
jgi:hypothetical protein